MVTQMLWQRCSLPVTSLLADAQKCKKGRITASTDNGMGRAGRMQTDVCNSGESRAQGWRKRTFTI